MDFVDKYLSNGLTLIVGTLLVLVISYRYYSAFLAARVLALDPLRQTPAYRLNDGHNYHPTNKWVLFGHHFAAIAGAGPLIGPVLAAQFGYLPGFLWILVGVCLAGAVQDFTILVLSTRRNGKSLAQLAFIEIGPVAGTAATTGIIFVLVIALAGLGKVVTKALGGEVISYPTGTHFVAPQFASCDADKFSTPPKWRIPADTVIEYPNGAKETVGTRFIIEAIGKDTSKAVDLDPHKPKTLIGSELFVPADVDVVRRIDGSTWGSFTITLTIPIALFVGWYIYRFRKGKVLEASIIGGLMTLGAVYLGGLLDGNNFYPEGSFKAAFVTFLSTYRDYFNLSEHEVGIAIAVYGFIAAILPVWVLLCPRDYLSSFLKIGTVILLVIGIIFAHPHLNAHPINWTFIHGGPAFQGSLFPFVFIVIMCGAISGFHALVSSGTTPKMIENETHARPIGYGAMLIEGLVGVIALIAAAALPSSHYYHIQTSYQNIPTFQTQINDLVNAENQGKKPEEIESPGKMAAAVGENIQGRTSGAVTLALGIAKIFDDAAKNILGMSADAVDKLGLLKYWYHFAIMFEALFILTTIDTGTRVGRFLLQESMGKWIHPRLGRTDWWPSAIAATLLITGGWWYFLEANAMEAIWPMFGIANQMLAVMALAIGTVGIVHMGKKKYAWVTIVPMCFVILTTTTAAMMMFMSKLTLARTTTDVDKRVNAIVCIICILVIVLCTALVVINAFLSPPVVPLRPESAADNSLNETPASSPLITPTVTPPSIETT